MTIIVGFKAEREAIMLSDSRASSPGVVEDKLQKILPIKENVALAYAGNVKLASDVANILRQSMKSVTRTSVLSFLSELQRTMLNLFSKMPYPTDFMLGFISGEREAMLYVFRQPYFKPEEIKNGFDLIGSGEVIKKALVKTFKNEKTNKDIKLIADKIFITVSLELTKKLKDDSVGGMFQIILLEKSGIRPIRYGYIDIDPDQAPDSKSIEMQNGTWTQYDHTKKHSSNILKPDALLKDYPDDSRFLDYKSDFRQKDPKWHLLHFITCLALKKEVGLTEFNGTLTAIAKINYPTEIEMIFSLEYWGTAGTHNLEFILIKDGKSQCIYKDTIESKYIPESVELIRKVKFTIDKKGPAIIQVIINGVILARRALYFHQLKPEDLANPDIGNIVLSSIAQQTDEEMEKNKKAEVVYFAMCQDAQWDNLNLKFIQQSVSFYWEKYPLPLRQKIISSFRLPKGENQITIELVDASTREKWEVGNKKVVSESSFMANPIVGEFLIEIPKPGMYFLNAIVNDKRITSILFAAETSEAKWSYTMLEDDKKDVKNGQLLCLSKEAIKYKTHGRVASE